MAPIRDEARRRLLALKLVERRQHAGHPQCRNHIMRRDCGPDYRMGWAHRESRSFLRGRVLI